MLVIPTLVMPTIVETVGVVNGSANLSPMETMADGRRPARLRSKPSWLVNQAALHAGRLVGEAWAAGDARPYHYAVLAALGEFGRSSQATLSRRCGIDRSDIVAVVNELADRGFVERAPDPTDRRRNVITITPAGEAQLQRLDAALAEAQDALLAPLSVDEREQLARLLTRIVDHHADR
jgi:MarR family transcriptional regulator, lower aerobic nicotinate degradation pathway regulator